MAAPSAATEGLVLDGREHGGTLDWQGGEARLDALVSAYPSITVQECPSECAPTLTEILALSVAAVRSWSINGSSIDIE